MRQKLASREVMMEFLGKGITSPRADSDGPPHVQF